MDSIRKKANNGEEGGLPIGTVSALTGVNSFTLRAWERRYGFISPARTPSGRRVYTNDQIEQIRRILPLLDQGMAIAQAARLVMGSSAEFNDFEDDERDGSWLKLRRQMSEAIAEFDERSLESAYQEALSVYPLERVTERLLMPLLRELGTRWLNSKVGIAEEHFFFVYLRNKLGARFHHRRALEQGPRIVCACLPGERHELGLLLFALAAHDRGYRTVLLGVDMPIPALVIAAQRLQFDAIALSGFTVADETVWQNGLRDLVTAVRVPVFVGGPVSLTHRAAIGDAGAHALGCDFDMAFARLAEALKH